MSERALYHGGPVVVVESRHHSGVGLVRAWHHDAVGHIGDVGALAPHLRRAAVACLLGRKKFKSNSNSLGVVFVKLRFVIVSRYPYSIITPVVGLSEARVCKEKQ